MDGMIRYCVVKKNKGVLKRSILYTHLLFVPVDPNQYMYLALVSQTAEEENAYVAQLLVKLTDEIMEGTLRGEYEHFGKRFVEVEALKCRSSNPSQGEYVINIPRKGSYIKSDLDIQYQLEYSTVEKRMYILKGELRLATGEV